MAFDAPALAVDEQRPDGRTLVFAFSGEIHVSTATELRARIAAALEPGIERVVFDLGAVEFIDSTGLSVLLEGLRQVELGGGRLALAVSNPTVMRLFQITSLDETFAIAGDRAGALALLGEAGS